MQIEPWSLQDVVLLRSDSVEDHRGFFLRTMSASTLAEAGLDHRAFVEESQSRSHRGVLRGLHGRAALSEGKLVRCARGEIFEVVVDLRPTSSTFLEWDSLVLDDRSNLQVWIPPGFVHGFQAVSDEADVCYRMDAIHDPALDIALAWDDPDVGIGWPIADPILSARDRAAPSLAALRPQLDEWFAPPR
jgi:dTDP-4-dehydrorhamnose 3,5-epimerase